MAKVKTPNPPSSNKKTVRPATTPEAREMQLASFAFDLVEQRLLDGTASAQETVHFLKLVSQKTKLELERAKLENELIKAKTQSIKDQADMKALYKDAIDAMRRYGGHGSEVEEEDDYDEY